MQTIRPFAAKARSSSSGRTRTPDAAARATGALARIDARREDDRVEAREVPDTRREKSDARLLEPLDRVAEIRRGRRSVPTTRAPRFRRNRQAATPDRARPITATRVVQSESSVRGAHRSFTVARLMRAKMKATIQKRITTWVLPADELEVVVEQGHAEDAFARELERRDLSDHRERLNHEEAANGDEEQFLLDEDRHGAESAAQSERAHVAHEHLAPDSSSTTRSPWRPR